MNDTPCNNPATGWRETPVLRLGNVHAAGRHGQDAVILERPLSIEVDGDSYTLLRTPGADRELTVGFLFTEGLIGKPEDILMLRECSDSENAIVVKTAEAREKPQRSLLVTSSCGLCGREDMETMVAALGRVESTFRVRPAAVYRVPDTVRPLQPLFERTGGAHAAAFFDAAGNIHGVKEDVGRHNALDKLIGYGLLNCISLDAMGVFLSGRTSLEMVAKAARAGIPLLAAVGAPTMIAIEAADRLGITLCGFLRDGRISVYTHAWRIAAPLSHAAGNANPASKIEET